MNNDEIGIGTTKHISQPDELGFINKFFKKKELILPLDEQIKILEKKKQYFGEYIPETTLCATENGGYYIRQRYIKGKTLASTDVSSLSTTTLFKLIDLIKKYLKYHKEQGGIIDLTGYQHYKSEPGPFERKIRNFLKIYKNFLSSTNIMISDDGNVYMVDVCETTENRLQGKIKNFCAKPFIRMTIHNLEKLFKSKMKSVQEKISNDLVSCLE